MLSTAGAARTVGDSTGYANGGTVRLATAGNLITEMDSIIDVSGSTSGGDAGTLAITTSSPTGLLNLDGTLKGTAKAGYVQGSAVLDLAVAGSFSALNARLNQGGFSESRDIRVRTGNVTIAGRDPFTQQPGDVVIARHFKLSADDASTDGGSIFVNGTIDASDAAGGGSIELNAMKDLVLSNGSFLLARGTSDAIGAADAYSPGGDVALSARQGKLTFVQGATIDVSANANGKSDGGTVLLSAPRTVDGKGVDAALAGRVNAGGGSHGGKAGTVTVEGLKIYTGQADTTATADASGTVATEYQAFMAADATIRDGFSMTGVTQGQIHVRGAIELQSDAAMDHSVAWDLTSTIWNSSSEPGRLTLRAAGDLTIRNLLGLPNDDLPVGRTWDIRLVGGADLNSADSMAVNALQSGDVSLTAALGRGKYRDRAANTATGTVGKVRTGTGDIAIAAARDFIIGDTAAVVHNLGSRGSTKRPGPAGAAQSERELSRRWGRHQRLGRTRCQRNADATVDQRMAAPNHPCQRESRWKAGELVGESRHVPAEHRNLRWRRHCHRSRT